MKFQYKGGRVLVFGLGLNQGGVGSAKFFATQGAKVRVTDLKSENILKPSLDQLKDYQIEYTLGKHEYEDIDWADLIIKNPAVKPGSPYMEYAKKKGKKVEMDMGIFLEYVKPSQIIGVTGTKGKSTTVSLIYEVLKAAKKNVIFAGNIGKSVLDTIPYIRLDTLVVLEISSFQLESFDAHKISPKWAIITNLTPDHLNYYRSIDEYIADKKLIGKYQGKTDFLFIRKSDLVVDQSNFLKNFKAKIIRFSAFELPTNFKPKLAGNHNLENMAAALAVVKTFRISKEKAIRVIKNFKGIPYRMELIKTWRGIKIINDTCASSPEASIQAIKTFPGCILICGGMNKGMDYTEYAKVLNELVKKVYFLEGDSTDEIKKQFPNGKTYSDLEKLLTDVKPAVQPGNIILFSPAATSFNLFQNEFDRGRKFNEAVEKIFKNDS